MEDIIQDFKDFSKRSHDYFESFYKRIKDERKFMSGAHFDKDDNTLLGNKRLKTPIDVISNTIRSIANQYTQAPYGWLTGDPAANDAASKFLNTSTAKNAPSKALKNAVSFGLGIMSETIDLNQNVTLYSIDDVTKVYLDPDSVEIDGSDAMKCAIVDIKSKDWVKHNYGIELIPSENRKPLVDIPDSYDVSKEMPLVTYYVKENDGVHVYKLLGNAIINEPTVWPIDRIPVFPVFGDSYFDSDDKLSYRGIVSQARPIQKLIDFCYNQLCERLAKAPKNAWLATKDAIENFEEYYKNFDKTVNPLLMWNKGKKDNPNAAPQRIDMSMQYNDLGELITQCLGMMQNVTGVAPIGIPDTKNEITATEALLNVKSFANNIRNYFDNLKESFRSAGIVYHQMFNRNISVEIESGPEDQLQRQTARVELMQLASFIPEDKKMDWVGAITHTMDDNQFIRKFNESVFANRVDPMVAQLQAQMQQMQQSFQAQMAQAAEQNKALQDQLQQANVEIIALQNSNKNNLIIAQMNNEKDLQLKAMSLNAEAENKNADRVAKYNETIMKEQEENARFAAKLQNDNAREIIKAGGMI